MNIKLFLRNALDATKLHANFQKISGVTPPHPLKGFAPAGLAAARTAHCKKGPTKPEKVQNLGHPPQ